MKTINEFKKAFNEKRKISMLTCYDHWTAQILNESEIDCLLVGDSVAMVMHGFETPVAATVEMMAFHIAAVRRGAPNKLVVGDMPFLSFRKGLNSAMQAAQTLMQAGAQALKLEGIDGHEDVVRALVQSGIPVMGHLGLTPQSLHAFGGFKIQGREAEQAMAIESQAIRLQDLGCFSLVLECVPSSLASKITETLKIPTIGIGAGPDTSGQVLVLQDLLGVSNDFQPKFLKKYANFNSSLRSAVNEFHHEVKNVQFPTIQESYE